MVTIFKCHFNHNRARVHISLHRPITEADMIIIVITTTTTTQIRVMVTTQVGEAEAETLISEFLLSLKGDLVVTHTSFS